MRRDRDDLLTGLPGEVLVRKGLDDLQAGRVSIAACLIAIARTRLTKAGLIEDRISSISAPEQKLYNLLVEAGDKDAYSRYNSLLRELVSFENALTLRLKKLRCS